MPRKNKYFTLNTDEWIKFGVDWRPFSPNEPWYLQMGIPPHLARYYRYDKVKFWNEDITNLSSNISERPLQTYGPPPPPPPRSIPPWILTHKYENFHKPYVSNQGVIKISGTATPDNMVGNVVYGTVIKAPPSETGKTLEVVPDTDDKGTSVTVITAICSVFVLSNLFLVLFLYLTWYRKKKRTVVNKNEETPTNGEDTGERKLIDGCNIVKMVGKSERSDDTYEAVKTNQSSRFKLPRQMSTSTIDAHTKVRDWITNEIVYKYSPRFLRRPPKAPENVPGTDSTLGRSPTRPVSPNEHQKTVRPPLLKSSSIPVQKNKSVQKVSIAVDATPSGRGPSVLAQQPIELSKSLDRPNFDTILRRSLTMEDCSILEPIVPSKQELRKSTTSINLKYPPQVIKIAHSYSKSDPVQDFPNTRILRTFDPNADVNVTSLDDKRNEMVPLTPQESLMTIKRRNFPKVLPDYPTREALAKKRRSMPVPNKFIPIPEGQTFGSRLPPAPPQRTTSTLSRQNSREQPIVCQSAPVLALEPPPSPEPEVSCNNLYFGPLIPKLDTQLIYEKLKYSNGKNVAKTVKAADQSRKMEPKVIIKPSMTRMNSDPKKNIPRVNLTDETLLKPSQIPVLASSSSESSPSDESSDTGTVVKKV